MCRHNMIYLTRWCYFLITYVFVIHVADEQQDLFVDARLPPKQSSQILDGDGDGDDTVATSTTTPLTGSMTTSMASLLVGRLMPDETLPQCSPTPVMPASLPTRMTMLDETAETRGGNEDGGDILDFMQGWAVISSTTTSTSTINGTNADGRLVTTGRLEDVPVDPTRDCEYLLQLQHGATVEVDAFELRPLVEGPVVDVRYLERPPDPLRDPIHYAITRTLQALEGKQRMGLGGVARWAIHRHGMAVQAAATAIQRYRDVLLSSIFQPLDEARTVPPRHSAEEEMYLWMGGDLR
eukprot:s2834_g6.t1